MYFVPHNVNSGVQSKIFFARSAREIILCPTSKTMVPPDLHACYYATNILTATYRMSIYRYSLASALDRPSNAGAICSVNIRMSLMTRNGRREQTSSRFQSFAVPPSSRAWFGNFSSCQSLLQMPAVSHQPHFSTWYNRVAFSCEWGIRRAVPRKFRPSSPSVR
jgi:hypothetical protein